MISDSNAAPAGGNGDADGDGRSDDGGVDAGQPVQPDAVTDDGQPDLDHIVSGEAGSFFESEHQRLIDAVNHAIGGVRVSDKSIALTIQSATLTANRLRINPTTGATEHDDTVTRKEADAAQGRVAQFVRLQIAAGRLAMDFAASQKESQLIDESQSSGLLEIPVVASAEEWEAIAVHHQNQLLSESQVIMKRMLGDDFGSDS